MLGRLAACRALPPAPVVPFHASTAAEPVGEVTAQGLVTPRDDYHWASPPPPTAPRSEFYVYGSIGTVVPLGDTGNALSLDLGIAQSLRDGAPFLGLSLADTQH